MPVHRCRSPSLTRTVVQKALGQFRPVPSRDGREQTGFFSVHFGCAKKKKSNGLTISVSYKPVFQSTSDAHERKKQLMVQVLQSHIILFFWMRTKTGFNHVKCAYSHFCSLRHFQKKGLKGRKSRYVGFELPPFGAKQRSSPFKVCSLSAFALLLSHCQRHLSTAPFPGSPGRMSAL